MRDRHDGWGSWPDDGDPIGVASARLLALGVDRSERLTALRFLGILLDHADAGGVVRAEPALLAGEFSLSAPDVDRYVGLLHQAGVLAVDQGGLRIEGFGHHRSTGLPDGEALALIASVLDRPVDEPVPDVIDLTAGPADPAMEPTGPTVPVDHRVAPVAAEPAPAPEPEPERVLVGAAVGGPATGTAGPTSRRGPAGRRPGGSRRPPVTSMLALLTGLVLVLSGVFARPGERPVAVSELAAGGPVTTIELPSTVPRTFVPSTSASPASTPAAPVTGDVPVEAPAPPEAAAPADTPDDASTPAEITAQPALCPDLVPAVSGVVTRVEPAELDSLLGASPWVVIVEGAVRAGAESATVSSLPIRVALADGSQINGEALTSPVTIVPGRMVRWEMRAQTVSIAAPVVTTVTAGPPQSHWVDDARAAACPIA